MKESPAREGPAPCCFAAATGEDVDAGAADELQGAAVWETGSATGGAVSERDSGGGGLAAPRAQVPALWGLAGCTVGSPEGEPCGDSSRLGGPKAGCGGSAGGGGGGDGGGRLDGGGDGGGCCCRCSGGGCCCCGRGGGGGSDGPSDHGVASEDWGRRVIAGQVRRVC